MGEALKELGKFLFNLALVSVVALILQPLSKRELTPKLISLGLKVAAVGVIFGFILVWLGEKLNNKGE